MNKIRWLKLRRQTVGQRYALALLVLAVTIAIRVAATPVLGSRAPTIIFTFAVMFATSLGGLGPGIFTMIAGFLAARYLWIPPIHDFRINSPDLIVYTIIYFTVSSGIMAFSLLLRASLMERVENEQRFGSLFQYNLDAVFVLDTLGRFVRANPQALRLTGFSEDELTGRSLDSLCRPDQRQSLQYSLQRVLESGRPMDFEFSILRKDGSTAELLFSAGPVIVEDEASGIFGVAKDITNRKNSAAVLRDVVKSVKCILTYSEVLADEGYEQDTSGFKKFRSRLTVVDEEAAQHVLPLEVNRGETYGEVWLRSRHPEDAKVTHDRACRALIAGEKSYSHEFRAKDKFGQEHWFLQIVSVEPRGPRRWLRVAVTTEITDRKQAEAELVRAKDQAENANVAKDRFIAVLSHELRTPLNPVLMAIHAWKDEPGIPDQLRHDLYMMRHNIEIEVRLISDLLDLTAINKGKLTLHFQPVDVHELLNYACNIAQSQGGDRAPQVIERLSAGSHYVHSDPTRLQQVFWNLISNAVKFSPDGGTVLVTTRNDSEMITVQITDTGVGMDEEIIQRIFDPFEQGNPDVTNAFGGLGLGLAIAKGFVELLGGTIRAESDGKGKGATFSVTLKTLEDPLAAGL